MNELALTSSVIRLPAPRTASALSFRLATMDDIPRLDALQKPYSKALGFFKTDYFRGYIQMGAVLLAETERVSGIGCRVSGEGMSPEPETRDPKPELLGYCISRDRYLKRDELGVIFQLCVSPGEQRKLVGAALVREVFARSAYGCKLYCLWCAKDLEANFFWESMGFLPIAFRAGSKSKGPKGSARVHIFWQRRIREGDTTTPYWFPSKTEGGAIGEERLVLPIPPGTHWRDVEPIVLPGTEQTTGVTSPALDEKSHGRAVRATVKVPKPVMRARVRLGPPPSEPQPDAVTVKVGQKPKREKKPKAKHDPRLVAKARELRDRYLEHVNSGQLVLESSGKYDVARALPGPTTITAPPVIPSIAPPKQLPHAA